MPVEHIHLSQQAKEQLIKLKRTTGITNWNVLCRWAFCVSLSEPSRPAPAKHPADSSVEMSWKVFAGAEYELYWALLKARCARDRLPTDEDTLAQQFRLHLHRGIGYLAANRRSRGITEYVADLLKSSLAPPSLP